MGLTVEVVESIVIDSVKEFFDTMLSGTEVSHKSSAHFPNEEGTQPPAPVLETEGTIISASVGFLGAANGICYIYLTEPDALLISMKFLGMDEEELEEEGPDTINDAIGELGNMMVGSIKNKICDVGYTCRLTLPSILRGTNIEIEAQSDDAITRHILHFEFEGHTFAVDVSLKTE